MGFQRRFGKKRGPSLPPSLSKELEATGSGTPYVGQARGRPAKRQRVQEGWVQEANKPQKLHGARQQRQPENTTHTTGRKKGPAGVSRRDKGHVSTRRAAEAAGNGTRLPHSRKTMFYLLLEHSSEGVNSREGFINDVKMQQQLAKKLKLKKGKEVPSKDGLDGFLRGITAGSKELLGGYTSGMGDLVLGKDDADLVGPGDSAERVEGPTSSEEEEEEQLGFYSDSDEEGSENTDQAGEMLADDDDDDDDDMQLDRSEDGEDEDMVDDEETGEGEQEEAQEELVNVEEVEDEVEADDAGVMTDPPTSSYGDDDEGEEGSKEPVDAIKCKKRGRTLTPVASGRYIPPALRQAAKKEDEKRAQVERRVIGLLNRLAEANLQGIVGEMSEMYGRESRVFVRDSVVEQLLQAVGEGPRASHQFAAVAAAFVAALTGHARDQSIAATFLASLANRLESAYVSGDSLSMSNLVMVLAYLYTSGLVKCDLLYSWLKAVTTRFDEKDVSMMLTLLNACGLQLRGDDPVTMKEFVLEVHKRAGEEGQAGKLTKRAELMLELVVDIKNNRKKSDPSHKGGALGVLQPQMMRWVRQCGVADVQLQGLTWSKLLSRQKKGIWWLPSAADAQNTTLSSAAPWGLVSMGEFDGEGEGADGGPGLGPMSSQLVKLAAKLRMNTDVRRAVFFTVMGSEDCVEAYEKLLRLPLKGEQEREVIRVVVECALQEEGWNPYYGFLVGKLCGAAKSHKVTLQYCLWDKLKELTSSPPRWLANLSRLTAHLLGSFVLSPVILKVVDFSRLAPREVAFWRMCLVHIMMKCKEEEDVNKMFSRIASRKELSSLSSNLVMFLKTKVGPWLAIRMEDGGQGLTQSQVKLSLKRVRLAEKVLGKTVALT